MLLQSPGGPATAAQARQRGSPRLGGSPPSAPRWDPQHPPGEGGGRGRGSPGWALGRAGAVSMKHHWSAPPSILPPPASASASRQPWHAVTAAGDRQGTGGGGTAGWGMRARIPHPLCPPDGFGCVGCGAPSPPPRVTELLSPPALSTARCWGSSAHPNADDNSTTLSTGAAWHRHMHTTMPGSSGCFSALPLPAHGSQRGACHGFIITRELPGTKGAACTTLLTAPPSEGCCGVSVETPCVRRSTQVAELAQRGSPAGARGRRCPSQPGATPKEKCLAGCPPCSLAQILSLPRATCHTDTCSWHSLCAGTAALAPQHPLAADRRMLEHTVPAAG